MRRFKNILYFADGATEPSAALQRAVRLAETNHARLTVVDVLEPIVTPSEVRARFDIDLKAVLRERRLAALNTMIAPFASDDELFYTEVLTGTPFIEVIRSVKRRGYDLLIKAAHSPEGFTQRLFGSTDLHLLRKCPCPVWIDRATAAPHYANYANILAAVDPMAPEGEGCDRLVLDLASSLTEHEGARLTVVHAWRLEGESMLTHGRLRMPDGELEDLLHNTASRHHERLAALLAPYRINADDDHARLVKGEAAPVIREVAERLPADLIVMGTLGRIGVPGFFIGNTAEEVMQTTDASVLAVKPAGFVSPVE